MTGVLTRMMHHITVQSGNRIAQCDPRRAWSVLLIPTALVVLGYLVWSASLVMRPLPARSDSYSTYLRTEITAMQQQIRRNELSILAVQVRQRKIELDLAAEQYRRSGAPLALPPVFGEPLRARKKE